MSFLKSKALWVTVAVAIVVVEVWPKIKAAAGLKF